VRVLRASGKRPGCSQRRQTQSQGEKQPEMSECGIHTCRSFGHGFLLLPISTASAASSGVRKSTRSRAGRRRVKLPLDYTARGNQMPAYALEENLLAPENVGGDDPTESAMALARTASVPGL